MYVGESEEKLRNSFKQARLSAPAILFLDEFDAFCSKRGKSGESGGSTGDKLLATFLTEMDGLEQVSGVIVLAASNRPEDIDQALLRPGRFDALLYVPPPTQSERLALLTHLTKGMHLHPSASGSVPLLVEMAGRTEGFTGAELEALCREAFMNASFGLTTNHDGEVTVSQEDFGNALLGMTPLLDKQEIEKFEKFSGARKQC